MTEPKAKAVHYTEVPAQVFDDLQELRIDGPTLDSFSQWVD